MKPRHRSVAALTLASAIFAFGSVALAQETKTVPAGAGAPPAVAPTATAPAAAAAANPEAQAALEKVREAYKKLKSYQDKAKIKFEMKFTDPSGQEQGQDDTEEIKLLYAGAKKYVISNKDFGIYSDGTNQTAHLKIFGQYIQKPASDGIMEEATTGTPIGFFTTLHIPAALFISPAKYEKQFPLMTKATEIKAEQHEGKAGKRVSGMGKLEEMGLDTDVPMTVWISDETGLIGEVTLDMKPAYEGMMGNDMKIKKAMGTIIFTEIVLNSEIPADQLAFKAGESDKKVDSFAPENGPDPQQELVGKAAPDFKGVDLEGKPLNLSDYKGKVLVLDFWATWCGPCMQAIPKMQELSQEYAGKDVVVLGMNSDDEGAKDKVVKAVEQKKLTFRQFMDPTGEVSQQFRVSGIPCYVIIDGKGIIQKVHVGATPGLKKELSENIDTLLKGGSLIEKKEEKPAEEKK